MSSKNDRPMAVLPAVVMSLLFPLGGCLTLPDRDGEPPSPITSVPGLSQTAMGHDARWPTDDWWRGIDDPALAEVVEAGLAASPDIAVAKARYRRAVGVARSAGGSSWPSLGVGGDMARTRQSDNGMLPTEFFENPYTDHRALASLSWDLSFWGAEQKEADAADREVDATRIEIEGVRRALAVAIAQAYYTAGLARQEVALADDGLTAAQKLYELIALRWEKGIESRLAERRSFTLLSQAKADRAEAAYRLTRARNLLATLCGQGPDRGPELDRAPDLMEVPVPPVPADLPIGLLARRPDLAALLARVEGGVSREKAAEARFYPSINLAAFVGVQSLALDTLFDSDSLTWSAGPALRIPLFMGGRLRGGLMAARGSYDEAVARYHGRVVEAARQVADRLADIEGVAQRLASQNEAVTATLEASRLARLRYERGIDDYRSPLDAEMRLLTTKRIALRLKGEGIAASIGLIGALGGGYTPEGIDHDQR